QALGGPLRGDHVGHPRPADPPASRRRPAHRRAGGGAGAAARTRPRRPGAAPRHRAPDRGPHRRARPGGGDGPAHPLSPVAGGTHTGARTRHGRRRAPMAGDAAAAQLWGISGPAFLAGYLAAAAAVLATALVLRLLAGRGPRPSRQPDPVQLAYLNGGGRLAIYAALAALRSTDAVAA